MAEQAGLPLTIAGIIQDSDYFERLVEPRLDGERVTYVGAVGPDRRGELLGGARALLHLVSFDEPFGFSVVEAMACGTPVIAHRARLDARDRPRRRERLPRRLGRRGGRGGARGRRASTGRAVRASVEQRFDSTAWSTTISPLPPCRGARSRATRGNVA